MRCELALLATVASATARAETFVLVSADSYVAATRDSTDAADVAWSAHLELRDKHRATVLDWVERESLIGGTPRRELHELSYVERSIEDVAITAGRFRVPGGFWLIADGLGVAHGWGALEASMFGGLRSFSNGREELVLTANPHVLPLAGAAIALRGDVQAALSYTYTADRVSMYRGDGTIATSEQPEQFIDAELAAAIGEHGFISAGATSGSRYIVTYPTRADVVADDPKLENLWFGSQAAYGMVSWRRGSWGLAATTAALRTKLGQAEAMELASISGSFVESTLRATWRRAPAWQVDARYRVRVWADRRHTHRGQLAAQWRHAWLDVQANVGLDVHRTRTVAPGIVDAQRLVYRASVGHKTERSELAVGVAATAALGDEVSVELDQSSDDRAPYTLEARNYGFVRLFGTAGAWFGGIDGELDLRGDAIRVLVQIGCSR